MKILIACLVSIWMALSLPTVFADEPEATAKPNNTQRWEGTLEIGVAKLRLRFEISVKQNGEFAGNLISIDQGNAKIPLSAMTFVDDKVTMEFKAASARFEGNLNEDRAVCEGQWHQAGQTHPLKIRRVALPSHLQTWQGDLVAGPKSFELQLRIETEENGKHRCRLDNFTQRMLDVKTEYESTKEGFKFSISAAKASYSGTFNDDQSEVIGHWTQGGAKLPLTFKKVPIKETRWNLPRPERPQHPKAPYPYDQEQVTFKNKTDGIELSGTLTLPKTTGRVPAVILVSGSGPQDRDETLFGHKPFLVIADHLTRNGIAVLRYDDRGFGKSTGKFAGATTEDFSRDAESGIDFLMQHAAIDPNKVGVIGHSEGGMIGPIIASRRSDLALIVMLAGPGITGAEISASQSRAIGKAAGLPDEYLQTQEDAIVALIAKTKKQGKALTEDQINVLLERIAAESETKSAHVELMRAALKRLADPWMADFLVSDPEVYLSKVRCPVLAMNGEKDLQVLPDLNLKAIEKHLRAAGNQDFKTIELPGLNHLFQTCETGALSEYVDIEETFSPKALDALTDWILERTE